MAFTAFVFWLVAGVIYIIGRVSGSQPPVLMAITEIAKWTFIVALAAWFYLSK
jgi:hypothetical protein